MNVEKNDRLSLCKQILEDWQANGKDWTRPGFRAMAVHRFGTWRMRIRPRLLRAPLSWLYHRLHRYIRNHYGIELHSTTVIGRRFRIGHQSGIVIHPNAQIGDDCVIRQNVTIGAPNLDRLDEAPVLGNRVEVGAGAVLLGKITIGDGVRIGPNTVVMTNVPAGATVFTNPGRIVPPLDSKEVSQTA
jgi:serine O-acetyltransferase